MESWRIEGKRDGEAREGKMDGGERQRGGFGVKAVWEDRGA